MNKDEARRKVAEIAGEHFRRGDPVGWFEVLYQQSAPWADMQPNPALVEWFEREQIKSGGKSAVARRSRVGARAPSSLAAAWGTMRNIWQPWVIR